MRPFSPDHTEIWQPRSTFQQALHSARTVHEIFVADWPGSSLDELLDDTRDFQLQETSM
jgi:hypothetical protein